MKKIKDYYFKKAKQEGYPARSVYKLKEAQSKFKLLRRGYNVLDLGAAPGAWSKYTSEIVGKKGKVVAIDIKNINPPAPNVITIKADVFNILPKELLEQIGKNKKFDVVLSDMAPNTTGRKDVDHLRSIALAEAALNICKEVLKKGGDFFCKVFEGSDLPAFRKFCQNHFKNVKVFKPKSSRSESVEIFLYAQGFNPPTNDNNL